MPCRILGAMVLCNSCLHVTDVLSYVYGDRILLLPQNELDLNARSFLTDEILHV